MYVNDYISEYKTFEEKLCHNIELDHVIRILQIKKMGYIRDHYPKSYFSLYLKFSSIEPSIFLKTSKLLNTLNHLTIKTKSTEIWISQK